MQLPVVAVSSIDAASISSSPATDLPRQDSPHLPTSAPPFLLCSAHACTSPPRHRLAACLTSLPAPLRCRAPLACSASPCSWPRSPKLRPPPDLLRRQASSPAGLLPSSTRLPLCRSNARHHLAALPSSLLLGPSPSPASPGPCPLFLCFFFFFWKLLPDVWAPLAAACCCIVTTARFGVVAARRRPPRCCTCCCCRTSSEPAKTYLALGMKPRTTTSPT
ncbi:hypothetical protein BRADI_3g26190v3 [Brachypodium distachyon]|uniref:Uncharacterized protein n=1 Tax=Brachypodium distachyon TaxID=15368 RepID=A0A2K2CZB3_BRADI|nr:hypothetical protein BRADI_3g26190v3 [Brachypodium distachyon]PNT67363.1 hypothetical protein BRADI_3g26190v3 [Brachypodium distachyon]